MSDRQKLTMQMECPQFIGTTYVYPPRQHDVEYTSIREQTSDDPIVANYLHLETVAITDVQTFAQLLIECPRNQPNTFANIVNHMNSALRHYHLISGHLDNKILNSHLRD